MLNAANEIAVPAFLDGKILFPAIWHTVEAVMKRHTNVEHPSLDDILKADAWARGAAIEEVAAHTIACP